jgi:RimJ/RimL family protein N-acetyltransferase
MDWPTPISLHGTRASLVPLEPAHLEGLQNAAADGDIHRLWYTVVPTPEGMAAAIEQRLRQRQAGTMLPSTVIERGTGGTAGQIAGQIAGMTTYLNIDAANKRLEIGATWYRKSVQRTGLNTECKLLLLTHAFEELSWSDTVRLTSRFPSTRIETRGRKDSSSSPHPRRPHRLIHHLARPLAHRRQRQPRPRLAHPQLRHRVLHRAGVRFDKERVV